MTRFLATATVVSGLDLYGSNISREKQMAMVKINMKMIMIIIITLLYVVAGCKSYLEEGRYTWRHNSALQVLANYFRANSGLSLYVDLPCFHSPSIITGDMFRPDLILVTTDKKIYILELTVCFETNLEVNAERKRAKYQSLEENLKTKYKDVNFINLSISSLGIFVLLAPLSLKCVMLYLLMLDTGAI